MLESTSHHLEWLLSAQNFLLRRRGGTVPSIRKSFLITVIFICHIVTLKVIRLTNTILITVSITIRFHPTTGSIIIRTSSPATTLPSKAAEPPKLHKESIQVHSFVKVLFKGR
ncbi:hypothetical protein RRG08_042541 [Elysia crispata]|uniref:Uncharacterized protein n=1 Tax=Elysia crispata TaxID=231223 RepID=A0AAE1CJX5_9GAST|nr:hypothetical protein RRG08_042541 [Elysia crispata]